VDRIPVGNGRPGDVTKSIQKEYLGIARGTIPDRHCWLTMMPELAGMRA
jgi:branched-chain amino acid aminotransferase